MKKLILIIAPLLLAAVAMAQTRSCLRIMPFDELVRSSTWIGRVKVLKASKGNYRAQYGQLVVLQPVDTIEGDSSLQLINVMAKSNVPCAADVYTVGQELLVFLVPEAGLFHTQNFQYGMFQINDEIVRSWHGKDNLIADKAYTEVRGEIETFINGMRNPNPQPILTPSVVPNSQTPPPNQTQGKEQKPPQNPVKPPDKPPQF
jgi:hypothetical protein